MSTGSPSRRWPRMQVDMPVLVSFVGYESAQPIQGRATEISEGGAAVYAGIDAKPNDLVEIEFHAPSRARVSGIVRNRVGYCVGLEFLTPLADGSELLPQHTTSSSKPGTCANAAGESAIGSDQEKKARGRAVAYLALARALHISGRSEEARNAVECALACFLETSDARVRAKALDVQRMRNQVAALRTAGAILQQASLRQQRDKTLDPQLPGIIRAIAELLRQSPQQP
jgi:hypothetical protein